MADTAEIIFKHFTELTEVQRKQFSELKALYLEWNSQINVISRKDTDDFYTRHALHSLGIAKVMQFNPEAKVLDIGTGGGFPGIPLAIIFPETQFLLVDSIGKKIKVVEEVSKALGLKNVRSRHQRAEEIKEQFDFIVSRAVTAMPAFLNWTKGKFHKQSNHELKNGILYLKGGDLKEEMAPVKQETSYTDLADYFTDPFFETKKVVYVKMV